MFFFHFPFFLFLFLLFSPFPLQVIYPFHIVSLFPPPLFSADVSAAFDPLHWGKNSETKVIKLSIYFQPTLWCSVLVGAVPGHPTSFWGLYNGPHHHHSLTPPCPLTRLYCDTGQSESMWCFSHSNPQFFFKTFHDDFCITLNPHSPQLPTHTVAPPILFLFLLLILE